MQTYTLCDGWHNCWHVDGELQYFDTLTEARNELTYFFEDMEHAMLSFSSDDYRIVEVEGD